MRAAWPPCGWITQGCIGNRNTLYVCCPNWISTQHILPKVPITVSVPGRDWSIVKDSRVRIRLLLLAALDNRLNNTHSGVATANDNDISTPGRGGGWIRLAAPVTICAMSSWENLNNPAKGDGSTVDMGVVGKLKPELVSSISHVQNKNRQNCLPQC